MDADVAALEPLLQPGLDEARVARPRLEEPLQVVLRIAGSLLAPQHGGYAEGEERREPAVLLQLPAAPGGA